MYIILTYGSSKREPNNKEDRNTVAVASRRRKSGRHIERAAKVTGHSNEVKDADKL